jgi:hypothetical protein
VGDVDMHGMILLKRILEISEVEDWIHLLRKQLVSSSL